MNYPKSWDLLLAFYGTPQMLLAGLLQLYLESPLLGSFVALIGIAALIVLLSYAYQRFGWAISALSQHCPRGKA